MRCGGCGLRWREIEDWIREYDNIQRLAIKLIYAQIACALIGSLGALFNGVLLVNLGISLFALVAIESSSQSLARTYAVLLFSSILLDLSWFFLFSHHIWNIPSEIYGTFMYRLGASYMDNSVHRDADVDLRNSFLSPMATVVRPPSASDDVIGGSIYDPAYYSSLFEDGGDDAFLSEGGPNHGNSVGNYVSTTETAYRNTSTGRPFHSNDGERGMRKPQVV
ncbi:uncharacterized protein LOC121755837 isoform X2 [Salvia splendens]|uniref:uncharacterized protein LOC121755837 isoform X2 n=1 Tax=Salvia splendens TaxID=180675 RepID=UPI001C2789A5|nr:uncharacterized protein LOC121755837 isoform X2 [Salvia splendens]